MRKIANLIVAAVIGLTGVTVVAVPANAATACNPYAYEPNPDYRKFKYCMPPTVGARTTDAITELKRRSIAVRIRLINTRPGTPLAATRVVGQSVPAGFITSTVTLTVQVSTR